MNQNETPLDTSEPDPSTVKIITATQVYLMRNGARTTTTDITRHAGVSRPTMYRKFFALEKIISRVLTQKMVGMLGDITDPTSTKELIGIIVGVTNRVRRNEPVRAILGGGPELLVTYQFHQLGCSRPAIVDVLEWMLRALPGLPSEDPGQQALFILMLVQSMAFMANTASEYFDDASWKEGLRKILKGYLQWYEIPIPKRILQRLRLPLPAHPHIRPCSIPPL